MPLKEVIDIDNEAELPQAKPDAIDDGEQCDDIEILMENDDANEFPVTSSKVTAYLT